MKLSNIIDLILLAALWGAGFLFTRVAAPEFGPFVFVEIRVAIAALCLMPFIIFQWRLLRLLRGKIWMIAMAGLLNSCVPFVLFAFATLYVTAGFGGILNATSPLFGALIAAVWLKEKLSRLRIVGLFIGLMGVIVLVSNKVSFDFKNNVVLAIAAALVATFVYGIAANFVKKFLHGMPPLITCGSSMFASALFLIPFAFFYWPEKSPSMDAWISVALLGVGSTGIGYTLYYRLISQIGPTKAICTTFLVPVFAMTFGFLFLGEEVTFRMVAGCVIILIGTALTTGIIARRGQSGFV